MKTPDLYTALVALAIGVGVGILIAPAPGKTTRKKLLKGANNATDSLHYAYLRSTEFLGTTNTKTPERTEAWDRRA